MKHLLHVNDSNVRILLLGCFFRLPLHAFLVEIAPPQTLGHQHRCSDGKILIWAWLIQKAHQASGRVESTATRHVSGVVNCNQLRTLWKDSWILDHHQFQRFSAVWSSLLLFTKILGCSFGVKSPALEKDFRKTWGSINIFNMARICKNGQHRGFVRYFVPGRPAGSLLAGRPAGSLASRPAGRFHVARPAGQHRVRRPAGQTGWLAGWLVDCFGL